MPAAAAASARISGSSRSKPPQNASRPAASTNAPPRPCSAANDAARIAAGTCFGKPSGHTSGSRSAAARASAAARTRSTVSASSARQRRCSVSDDAARPGHVRERPLDPLRREVRERAGEVEEQLRAHRLAAACPALHRFPALCEIDQFSHCPLPSCVREWSPADRRSCLAPSNAGVSENWRQVSDAVAIRTTGYAASALSHAENGASPIPAAPPPKRHPYDQWSPDARALDLVGDKWTLLIIRDLAAGPRRFVELQRVLPGISTEQLRSRLNRMVADGLLTRQRYREVPPRVDYELTERSRELMPVLGALAQWGYDWTWTPPRAGRGRQRRRDLPPRPRPARAAGRAQRRRRPDRRGRRRHARAPLPGDDRRRQRRDRGARPQRRAERDDRRQRRRVGARARAPTAPPTTSLISGKRGLAERAAVRLLGRRAPQRPGRLVRARLRSASRAAQRGERGARARHHAGAGAAALEPQMARAGAGAAALDLHLAAAEITRRFGVGGREQDHRASPHSVQRTAFNRMERMASTMIGNLPFTIRAANATGTRQNVRSVRSSAATNMPGVGLEPTRPCGQPGLRRPRVPVPPPGRAWESYGYPGNPATSQPPDCSNGGRTLHAWKPQPSNTPAPPAFTDARRCSDCSRTSGSSRSSGAGTRLPSRRSSPATSRACWPSAATCCPRARTPRTCCRRSSPPPSTRCSPTSARSTCARGCTGSRATAR